MNCMDDELLQKHPDAARNSTLNGMQFYTQQNNASLRINSSGRRVSSLLPSK